jgi:hypothetical protein
MREQQFLVMAGMMKYSKNANWSLEKKMQKNALLEAFRLLQGYFHGLEIQGKGMGYVMFLVAVPALSFEASLSCRIDRASFQRKRGV